MRKGRPFTERRKAVDTLKNKKGIYRPMPRLRRTLNRRRHDRTDICDSDQSWTWYQQDAEDAEAEVDNLERTCPRTDG